MSEMIERVAKELAFDRCSYAWENMEEIWRVFYRTEARRIIAAMREPTGRMIQAGRALEKVGIDDPVDHYEAMICAALSEANEDAAWITYARALGS